ncbi:dTDP-4-amino-4,6-dideoxy-D-glucose ammonia-lyase [Nocardiopsis sp. NPDC058631]|uniref:dTDP-4-amino-4,6-dideoxy-D-glucose ammonia-lyase n=1 Tax=Nocardiopsis sp. NPDC058631 TaxID=3346566 RepID=UPI003662B5BE
MTTLSQDPVLGCALPGGDARAAAEEVRRRMDDRGLTVGEPHATAPGRHASEQLVALARRYGNDPFTTLEEARSDLGADRARFALLLDLFGRLPELREAVEAGPAGRYWTNTVLPLERRGVLDAVLDGGRVHPHSVGLYPGPTCMFRCHFCVRVTGARYDAAELGPGNERLAAVIDELPTDNPDTLYVSGGLEPLTNPGLGSLVTRAASRGFRITMYTNAFALTDATLNRQPGLWDLGAVRTSLYGLDDDEYEATTGKRRAFGRVRENLLRFQALRAERRSPVRLGLSYLILPGRAHRLLDLVDFVAELDRAAPDRPLDFLTLRQDYSGREDGRLDDGERERLQEVLHAFAERAAERTPSLHVDYGYALHGLMAGADAVLPRITPETMRPTAHPQVAVQVDIRGDVYLYREAGFPDLAGADRYVAGRVGPGTGLLDVVDRFVADGARVEPHPGDEYFMDGYDQVVTGRLNQLEADLAAGWGPARGFLR